MGYKPSSPWRPSMSRQSSQSRCTGRPKARSGKTELSFPVSTVRGGLSCSRCKACGRSGKWEAMQASGCMLSPMKKLCGFRLPDTGPRTALPRVSQKLVLRRDRSSLQAAASAVAQPATLELKTFSGETAGVETLALTVADPFTATGLVHRTVVTVRQNARKVRVHPRLTMA